MEFQINEPKQATTYFKTNVIARHVGSRSHCSANMPQEVFWAVLEQAYTANTSATHLARYISS